jgi:hypothetical protein
MNEFKLVGLQSQNPPENRSLLYLEVMYNGNKYDWQIFCPQGMSHDEFLNEETMQSIYTDIANKELQWELLDPKTRTIFDPITNEDIVIDIQKGEIVKPDIPDYFSKRRDSYPPIGDQLDAIWKGIDSEDFASMIEKIQQIKLQYPK